MNSIEGLLGHAQPGPTLGVHSHNFDRNKKLAPQKLAEVMVLEQRKEKQPLENDFRGLFYIVRTEKMSAAV